MGNSEHMRKRLQALEMEYWRRWCNLTLYDRIKNEEIRGRINICTSIHDTVDTKRLRWYGH